MPQAAAVWSADPEQMWTFPARFLVEFFDNHGMLGLRGRPRWRTVSGGSARYVEALTAPFADRIRLSTPVRAIERFEDRVEVTPAGGEPEAFDEVVIAAHADQALAMLADPTPAEREILGAFPYQANEAVLHTDRRFAAAPQAGMGELELPPGRRTRAGPATVTYHMNRLQSLDADEDYCVTLNRTERDRPGARSSARSPTRTRSTRSRATPPSAATTRSAAATARTTAAPTGAGASTRTASPARTAPSPRSAARRCRHDGERVLRGHGRRTAGTRCASTRSAIASRWPTSTSTSVAALRMARRRFRRSDHIGDPRRPLRGRSCARSPARTRRRAPCACSPTCARSGTASTPSASTTSSRRTARRVGAVVAEVTNTPWGDRHAYVLRARGRRARAGRRHGQADARLAVHGHGPALRRCAPPSRGRRCPCTSRTARTASGSSTRRSTSSAGRSTAAAWRATTARRCATVALIYAHAVALRLKGVPWHRRPEVAA